MVRESVIPKYLYKFWKREPQFLQRRRRVLVLGSSDCPFVILQRNWGDPGATEAHLYQEPRLPLAPGGYREILYKFGPRDLQSMS